MQVYADNAATTKMSRTAIETQIRLMSAVYGNPSSLHTAGQQAAEVLQEARETFAGVWAAPPGRSPLPPAAAKRTIRQFLLPPGWAKKPGKSILSPQHLSIMQCSTPWMH